MSTRRWNGARGLHLHFRDRLEAENSIGVLALLDQAGSYS